MMIWNFWYMVWLCYSIWWTDTIGKNQIEYFFFSPSFSFFFFFHINKNLYHTDSQQTADDVSHIFPITNYVCRRILCWTRQLYAELGNIITIQELLNSSFKIFRHTWLYLPAISREVKRFCEIKDVWWAFTVYESEWYNIVEKRRFPLFNWMKSQNEITLIN